jgi:hypothetical protein
MLPLKRKPAFPKLIGLPGTAESRLGERAGRRDGSFHWRYGELIL